MICKFYSDGGATSPPLHVSRTRKSTEAENRL